MKTFTLISNWKDRYASRLEPENMRVIAEAFWRFMLLLAFVGLFGVVAFGAWEFSRVMDALGSAAESGKAPRAVLDRTRLEETLRTLDARRDAFEAAKAQRPAVADPSR